MNEITKWLVELFPEVSAHDFYRGIFPAGELDIAGALTKGKYRGLIQKIRVVSGEKKGGVVIPFTDELKQIDSLINSNQRDIWYFCAPLSYAGRARKKENARVLYAIAVDLDYIRLEIDEKTGQPIGLANLWHQVTIAHYLPQPTYIVSSGTGLHLYYLLDKPMSLHAETAQRLQDLKKALTRKIWNEHIVKDGAKVQQEGIYQSFRMPGTLTKDGGRVKAFLTGERVSIAYLYELVKDFFDDDAKARYKARITKEEAARKWPEWYEKRVKKGEKRGYWCTNRRVYDWWKRQILTGATVGHRYYCMLMLAIYAQKCSRYDAKHNPNPVTFEELKRDCYELLGYMDSLTIDEKNHFKEDDIESALHGFEERWMVYPRRKVEDRSGITIKPNKRNGRKQETHLKIARSTLEVLNAENGKPLQGRKSKAGIVSKWRAENPDGGKMDCARDTGISLATVYRHWWDAKPEERLKTDIYTGDMGTWQDFLHMFSFETTDEDGKD